MLNFLISVIGQTYEKVMALSEVYTAHHQSELNAEFLFLLA